MAADWQSSLRRPPISSAAERQQLSKAASLCELPENGSAFGRATQKRWRPAESEPNSAQFGVRAAKRTLGVKRREAAQRFSTASQAPWTGAAPLNHELASVLASSRLTP